MGDVGDVLFSSTPWLQQDNLQEMGGRIKLACHTGQPWEEVTASIFWCKTWVCLCQFQAKKDLHCREGKKEGKTKTNKQKKRVKEKVTKYQNEKNCKMKKRMNDKIFTIV